jgi:hypothetical protein
MRWIALRMADGSEAFDARSALLFEMSKATAFRVFENRPIPAHVRILEDE